MTSKEPRFQSSTVWRGVRVVGLSSGLGSSLCGAAMLSMSICGFGPQPQLVLHSVAHTHDSGDS